MIVPTAAAIPYAFGTTTRQNVRHRPAPSSAAASSSSLGKAAKCCRNKKVAKAENSTGMIRPR